LIVFYTLLLYYFIPSRYSLVADETLNIYLSINRIVLHLSAILDIESVHMVQNIS